MGSIPTTSISVLTVFDKAMSDNKHDNSIDPEIAELIGAEEGEKRDDSKPDFDELFNEAESSGTDAGREEIDLNKSQFAPITKREDSPKPFFANKNYYKVALGGEGDVSKRFHSALTQFLNTQYPQERSLYRGRLIPAYWNLAESIALKAALGMQIPKKLILRFGAVLPTLISQEQRALISKIPFENSTGEPVHYLDEWLERVATGKISQSGTDEVKTKKQNPDQMISSKLQKAQGQRDVNFGLISGKLTDLEAAEGQLKAAIDSLASRSENAAYPGLKYGYSDQQRPKLAEISGIVRSLGLLDREISRLYLQLDGAAETLEVLKQKAAEEGVSVAVDNQAITDEFNTIRQMAKMCVGRQGNHLPVLMKQYFRSNILDIGTRENIIDVLSSVENIDPGVFKRTFKRQTQRIVPHVIIVPCYGDSGICWEPFERFNRATSRGRLALPMFPKDVKSAVITALADLRWQVAKEKAQHYWMEEGLTGYYYQWFNGAKKRGDVREAFVQDYALWVTKESEGMQKLHKDVRGVFWRYIPFNQELKDKLRNRGFVYDELYKRDVNRGKSDGY